MLGFYENFPQTIHRTEIFSSVLSKKKLQQRITEVFLKINSETYSFEEVGNPTVPNGKVIFEFGIADTGGFCYLNKGEAMKLQEAICIDFMKVMDWYCSIRYYKYIKEKKAPLKFDYYMLRIGFGEKGNVEFLVSYEKGPRYISPEDLVDFISNKVNEVSNRNILRHIEQS